MIPGRDIDLFGQGMNIISPRISAMSHINCHYVTDPSLEKQKILMGFPGSEKFSHVGSEPPRFIYAASNINGGLYVVSKNTVYKISRSGEATIVGVIDTDNGPISMADSGIEIMIVDGKEGYIINVPEVDSEDKTQTITKITAEFFPRKSSSVIFQMGRFLVNEIRTGKFWGSSIYDGKTWPGLNFATAETFPDNLLALANGNFGVFYLFGNETIETWYNTGGPDFPYEKMSGGVIKVGLTGIRSLIQIGDSLIFLGRSQASGIRVFMLTGQEVQDITTPDLGEYINNIQLPPALDAIFETIAEASAYSVNGTSIYQLTFGVTGRTFFYDIKTGLWGERKTRGRPGHIFGTGAYWFGEQFFTSRVDGDIYRLNNLLLKDGEYFQDLEFTGRHIEMAQNRFTINSVQIVCEVGTGRTDDINKPTQAMLSYSKDGGYTFSPEYIGSLGKIGDYLIRLIWRRLGIARDFVFRLKISDLSRRKIVSAIMNVKE